MSQNSDGFDLTDPLGLWRSFRDANLDAWAKGMTNVVGTDAFAQILGAQINTYLATSAPFQKAIDQYMEAYLARLNMPSRVEIIGLSERMTNIEMRLDDLDAKTDQMLHALRAQAPVVVELIEEKLNLRTAENGEKPESGDKLEAQLKALDERTEQLLKLVENLQMTPKVAPGSGGAKSRSRKTPLAQVDETPPSAHEAEEDRVIDSFQHGA